MIYNLFLDDKRNVTDTYKYTNNPVYLSGDWIIVRNYDSFVDTIKKHGLPNFVSFDHDLADPHYTNILDKEIDYSKDFFGKRTALTVSGQLQGEIFALAFKNIYTFGPTFRAENSNTKTHASEFWMIEPEIAFGDLGANMELAEAMVKYIIKYVMDNCPEEMEFFNSFIEKLTFLFFNSFSETSRYKSITIEVSAAIPRSARNPTITAIEILNPKKSE